MILGVVWLEILAKVTVDWWDMSMAFNYLGHPITFCNDNPIVKLWFLYSLVTNVSHYVSLQGY